MRKQEGFATAQQGLKDRVAGIPGRRLKPRRTGMHGNASAMPGEAEGPGDPLDLRLGAVRMGMKPMIDVHHPRGRPPCIATKLRREMKKG